MAPILASRGGISARAYGLFGVPSAAAGDFESIETVIVGAGGQSSITFGSGGTIPQTYKHLQIRALVKSSRSAVNDYMQIRINNDNTTSNYRTHAFDGDGVGVYGETSANDLQVGWLPGNTNASMYGIGIIDILDYTNTSKNKTIRTLGGFDQNSTTSGTAWVGLTSGLWMSNAAITSIKFNSGTSSNFNQYSSFALYGIKG